MGEPAGCVVVGGPGAGVGPVVGLLVVGAVLGAVLGPLVESVLDSPDLAATKARKASAISVVALILVLSLFPVLLVPRRHAPGARPR